MPSGNFVTALSASILACAITTAGIYVISRHDRWGKEYSNYFVSFAAGVLISVSFMHIIPESFEMSRKSPPFILMGFLLLYLSNRFLHLHLRHDYEQINPAVGIVPVLAIGIHSLIDGTIYAVTFRVSVFTGILAAIGMILHEFPEGIVSFVFLNRAGFSVRKSVLYAFFAAGLSTPLGTVLSYPFIQNLRGETLGNLIAMSAGALIYVGASHLLPEVEHENKRYSILAMGAGVVVAAIIALSHG